MVSSFAVVAVHAADIPALVQKAKPAVVEILTFDQQNKLLKTGTGFFVSPDGVLLTNYHVISGGSRIMAKTASDAVYVLKSVVHASEIYDVAELQFFATDVPCLTLASSSNAVEGQRVLVIGNPEGLEGTVSDGIISAFRVGRTMIQITAPVSPGSSGSPVLDESGSVIGIATQVLKEGQSLNFAISSEAIRTALRESNRINGSAQTTPQPTPNPSPSEESVEHYLLRTGRQRLDQKRYQEAIKLFTTVIEANPQSEDAYYFRGLAFAELSRNQAAIADFTEVIRLDAGDTHAYSQRGNLLERLGRYTEALSDFTKAIELNKPDKGILLQERANLYDKMREKEKAARDRADAGL
jgi:Flp pilus assembly protein TadD